MASDITTQAAKFGDSDNTLLLKIATAEQNAASGVPPSGAAGGDLSGTYPNPSVAKLAGVTLSAAFLTIVDDASVGDIRTTLGLGTIATQAASAVALTGGTINGVVIGGVTPAAITGTTITATGAYVAPNGTTTVPSIHGSDATTGVSFEPGGVGGVYVVIKGANIFQFYGNGQGYIQQVVTGSTGSAAPAVTLGGHTTTGVYFDGGTADPGFTVGGVAILTATATGVPVTVPIALKSYIVSALPSASPAGQIVYVSDAAVAPCLAFSNGTNWKRCDNASTTVV